MELVYAQLSVTGPVRPRNEDCVGFSHPANLEERRGRGALAVLADGVGGHGRGDVASKLAVETALRAFQEAKPNTAPGQLLSQVFNAANLAVYDASMHDRGRARMATTLAVTLFRNNEISVGHVGDSRVYLIQQGGIKPLTSDHSYVAAQVKMGLLTQREAMVSEMRSVLTRSVGKDPIVQVDCSTLTVHPGDRLVLCSDGLHGFVTDGEIFEVASRSSPEDACRELVSLAERRGSDDNISVQVVRVERVEQLIYYRGLPIYQDAAEQSMSHEIQVGQVLDDRFHITGVISRSGMASIFKATDLSNNRTVAIKVPFMQFESDPGFFDRFAREEEIGRLLDHPSILHIIPVEKKSQPYFVMEFLDGQTLRQLMRSVKPVPVSDALRIASTVCEALDYVHRHQIVHRDLKPENVMLCADGSLRILDFGIAKAANLRRLTFAGFTATLGTPDYMAPEQVKGKRGDERTDIYSLGAILYEMVTGAVPFDGVNPFAIMNARLTGDPVAPRKLNPEISPQVEEIILHALERDPADRYPSSSAMKKDLDNPDAVEVTGRHERLRPPVPWRGDWRTARLVVLAALVPVVVFGLIFLLTTWLRGGR
jgi:serine/threonine-protein kinase